MEWDVLFVINANKGLIPHEMNNDIEEKRRLFYVSCSRTRKKLYVSWFFYDKDFEIKKEGLFISELLGKDVTDEMKKDLFRGHKFSEYLYPDN